MTGAIGPCNKKLIRVFHEPIKITAHNILGRINAEAGRENFFKIAWKRQNSALYFFGVIDAVADLFVLLRDHAVLLLQRDGRAVLDPVPAEKEQGRSDEQRDPQQ